MIIIRICLGVHDLALGQPFQDEQDRPGGDSYVGKIEGRPVRVSPMEVEEVHDLPSQHAIQDIPKCATENQAVARCFRAGQWPPQNVHKPS